jgi:chromosomal replication initiator protein
MDLDRLWKNTQEELKIVLAPAVFQTFISKTQLVSLIDNIATIACPNSYLADINKKRYYDLFKGAIDNQTKNNNNIVFVVQEIVLSESEKDTNIPPLLNFAYSNSINETQNSNLHPKYTLKNLIVGNSNNFAYAAAQGIIKNPGLAYNPFFIWGPPGVGKTHLMQGIGHELLKNNPSLKIKYFPAETFGNEAIASMKSKTMEQFKKKYRNFDCILVDDIQFIAGKEYIQEEFFHTFNSLHMEGKQVILTSDRKPSDINNLSDRLVSRFMGGLTVDIQLPDFEMRTAIINQKLEEKGITITPEAANFIAQNTESNIRDIEGKVQEISIQSLTQNIKEINMDFIDKIYQNSNNNNKPFVSNKLTSRHIVSVCAKFFNVKTNELCGKSRKKEIVFARHITAYLLLNEIKLPLKEVGNILGGRDHTSIMHARDKVHTDFSTNPQTTKLINQLKNSL